MKFYCTAEDLKTALAKVNTAITSKPTQMVRAYAHFTVAKGGPNPVRITGSNDRFTLMAAVSYDGPLEPGEALVNPSPVLGLLNTLPGATKLTVETTNTHLRIARGDSAPYTFLLESGEYPKTLESREKRVGVDFKNLPEAIAAVKRSVGENRFIHLVSDNDKIVLSTTDNFRLSQSTLEKSGFGEYDAVLNIDDFESLARIAPNAATFDKRVLNVTSDQVAATLRVENFDFPNFGSVLNTLPTYRIEVDTAEFKNLLTRLYAVNSGASVTLGFEPDSMVMTLAGSVNSYGQEQLSITGGPDELMLISVNLKYLLDAVSSHNTSKIVLGFTAADTLMMLKSNNNGMEVLSAVMPVAQ